MKRKSKSETAVLAVNVDEGFDAIVELINAARQRTFQTVNIALIELYWQIGEQISRKIAAAEWGGGVVERLAAHIAHVHPGLRGFTRPNLFRMRQFYEAYVGAGEKVSALLRQIPWTHHLIILGQSKRPEEREFYLEIVAQQAALRRARTRLLLHRIGISRAGRGTELRARPAVLPPWIELPCGH